MNRRDFLKLSIVGGSSLMVPSYLFGNDVLKPQEHWECLKYLKHNSIYMAYERSTGGRYKGYHTLKRFPEFSVPVEEYMSTLNEYLESMRTTTSPIKLLHPLKDYMYYSPYILYSHDLSKDQLGKPAYNGVSYIQPYFKQHGLLGVEPKPVKKPKKYFDEDGFLIDTKYYADYDKLQIKHKGNNIYMYGFKGDPPKQPIDLYIEIDDKVKHHFKLHIAVS